ADDSGDVQVWDLLSGKEKITTVGKNVPGLEVVEQVSGTEALPGKHNLKFSDLLEGKVRIIRRESSSDTSFLWSKIEVTSADGSIRASAGTPGVLLPRPQPRGEVGLKNMNTGKTSVLKGHASPVWTLGISMDGQKLASADFHGVVIIW